MKGQDRLTADQFIQFNNFMLSIGGEGCRGGVQSALAKLFNYQERYLLSGGPDGDNWKEPHDES